MNYTDKQLKGYSKELESFLDSSTDSVVISEEAVKAAVASLNTVQVDQMQLEVEAKRLYGKLHYTPINRTALAFCNLLGKRSLSESSLDAIKLYFNCKIITK